MSKYVFVTGGVVSSLGKGIVAASLGRLLKSQGFRVVNQKLDPYLNTDPGTMSPYQHGEVFVTADGCETDLDLGHYERFTGVSLTRESSVTAGQVYSRVLENERRGEYLGHTVQVIPHVTNEIKRRVYEVGKDADFAIVEVGGTVGDIEGLPFLEAIRQVRLELGQEQAAYVHVTLLPYVGAAKELKTKPTQHSVKELRGIGVQPDVLVLRSDCPVPQALKAKVAMFCDVDERAVLESVTAKSVYEVPLRLAEQGFSNVVLEKLGLGRRAVDLEGWSRMVQRVTATEVPAVKVAVVGKYAELPDAYISITEALSHAGASLETPVRVRVTVVDADLVENGEYDVEELAKYDGVIVPGGFGSRGFEGKVSAVHCVRERGVPFLGICLGMQCAVTEYARNACGLRGASTTEVDPETEHPVITLMNDQREAVATGGTMRLGAYPCAFKEGTVARAAYASAEASERHRHRWEVNNAYRQVLEEKGLVVSGTSPDGGLVEVVELPADVHPFFVATQFHPEFQSRPTEAHPLFRGLVTAAAKRARLL